MIISTKKYACETCIKGHRSSSCKHTDRPLFEIKKKGRPVTQCEHCRELRKTKQVHVKCVCESKLTQEPTSQGSKSGFERAAFPNGLPQALEASVAFQTSADGSSSDSDHGGVVNHRPQCKSGTPCNCIVPKSRSRKKAESHAAYPSQHEPTGSSSDSSIMKRIAELRPVLPRPTHESGPVHLPSVGHSHSHTHRHHKSGQAPYELAYDMTHQQPLHHTYTPSRFGTNVTYPSNKQSYPMMDLGTSGLPHQWSGQTSTTGVGLDNLGFPSLCGCGDECDCPGCLHHNRNTHKPTASAYASCTNPGACSTCLDCTIMSLPASALMPIAADDTALSIPNAFQQGTDAPVAEWLRQVSATNFASNPSFSNLSMVGDIQQWADPSFMNSNFNYGVANAQASSESFPPHPPSGPSHQQSRLHPSASRIDPRLLSPDNSAELTMNGFLGALPSESMRSRSPSVSSQSSHHGSEGHSSQLPRTYTPSGRQQGMFTHSRHGGHPASQIGVNPNRSAVGQGSSSRSSSSLSPSPNPVSRPPFGP